VDKSLVIPIDNAVGFSNAYPLLHRDFSGGQQHTFSEQLGPDENGIYDKCKSDDVMMMTVLMMKGSFSIDDGEGSENVTFK